MTWNLAYKTKILEDFRRRISNLDTPIENVVEGRKMPTETSLSLGKGSQLNIVILFLDICDFTSLPSSDFNEQSIMLNSLNLFMSQMLSIIKDYGGYYEKNTGDGLMAYFGADKPDALTKVTDAVNAAITMHYFNNNILSPYFISLQKIPFRFRIGIDFGQVTISHLGIKNNNSFVAIGATANIACKLLEIGGAGDIVIGNDVKINLSTYEQNNFCKLMGYHEKFIYVTNGYHYPIWKYTAIWKEPVF